MSQVPFIPHPTPYTLHPTPYTLHPTHYALHPTPYTLRPTPYTPHPTPYTPHPAPWSSSGCPRCRARLNIHIHPGDNIRANDTSQKWTRPGMPPDSDGILCGIHFWEVPFAPMFSPGWRMCPVQTFGHARTNPGRAAGRDLLVAVDPVWCHAELCRVCL